jgi:hypothetical protein
MRPMDWSQVLPVLLGGAVAVVGGGVTQWLSERRRADHDRAAWLRNLAHEAHVQYLAALDQRYQAVARIKDEGGPPLDIFDGALTPVWDRLQSLRIVCTPAVTDAAERAYWGLNAYAYYGAPSDSVEVSRNDYLTAVREGYGLPPAPLKGDPDGGP